LVLGEDQVSSDFSQFPPADNPKWKYHTQKRQGQQRKKKQNNRDFQAHSFKNRLHPRTAKKQLLRLSGILTPLLSSHQGFLLD